MLLGLDHIWHRHVGALDRRTIQFPSERTQGARQDAARHTRRALRQGGDRQGGIRAETRRSQGELAVLSQKEDWYRENGDHFSSYVRL